MLERLAQLIVDKIEPKIERMVKQHFDEMLDEVSEEVYRAMNDLNIRSVKILSDQIAESLPEIENSLQKRITHQIVKGMTGK